MKRILSLILVSLMLLLVLISCNEADKKDTSTDTDSQAIDTETSDTGTDTSTDTNTDTNTDTSTDTNPDSKDEVKTNNVTVTETDTYGDYYTRVNYYEVSEPNVLPDRLAYNKAYFKMFNSLDDLRESADTNVTESTFKDNYVVLIESVFTIGGDEYESLIGYYDFKYVDGKYSISKDYSYSTGNRHELRENAKYDYSLDYIIVPRNEIEFTEDVHEIKVDRIKRNKETFFYAKPSDNTPLPTEPTAFIVNREKAEQMGLKVSSYGSSYGYKGEVLILYMPDQIMSNLAITECEIKNGNLYITIEKYDENAEDVIIPIEPDDVIFYEIYCDTSKLSENFEVFVDLYDIWLRNIPKPQYINKGSQIEITQAESEHSYYSQIRKWEGNAENKFNFPKEQGSYFMLISSYEEMESYFSTNEVDASVFEDNYIMVLYQHYDGTYYGETEIGYRALIFENGEYKITNDWFYELGDKDYPEWVQEFKATDFLIIPKGDIEYVSGIQEISVEGYEIKSMDIISLNTYPSTQKPSKSSAYLIDKDSKLISDFNLPEIYFTTPSLLLYLANEPYGEFILTEKEIKNGDLYITLQAYNHLQRYDRFYRIGLNANELKEDFKVYIQIDNVAIPTVYIVIPPTEEEE